MLDSNSDDQLEHDVASANNKVKFKDLRHVRKRSQRKHHKEAQIGLTSLSHFKCFIWISECHIYVREVIFTLVMIDDCSKKNFSVFVDTSIQKKVHIERLDVTIDNTKLPAVKGEFNNIDEDSDPRSDNGSVSTQRNILNRITHQGRGSLRKPSNSLGGARRWINQFKLNTTLKVKRTQQECICQNIGFKVKIILMF